MRREDYEERTRGGVLIKIKPARLHCIVFFQNKPENSSIDGSMEQTIPAIAFIGKNFSLTLPVGEISLVPSRGGRLAVPYRLSSSPGDKHLSLSCGSASDQFPVLLKHYESPRQFLSGEGSGHPFRYLVLDQSVPRIDMVTLKVKNPEAQMLIVQENKSPGYNKPAQSPVAPENMRATDIAEQGGGDSRNPVFMARIYLRNLNLDQVRQLLFDFDLKAEEVEFIRTFLRIMIKNENGKRELQSVQSRLEVLDELYRLSGIILSGRYDHFNHELDKGLRSDVAGEVRALVSNYRLKAVRKEDEIRYWEWEYRIQKMEGGAELPPSDDRPGV